MCNIMVLSSFDLAVVTLSLEILYGIYLGNQKENNFWFGQMYNVMVGSCCNV